MENNFCVATELEIVSNICLLFLPLRIDWFYELYFYYLHYIFIRKYGDMFIYSDHHQEIAFSLFLNNVEIEGGKLSYLKKGAEYSCQNQD